MLLIDNSEQIIGKFSLIIFKKNITKCGCNSLYPIF